MNYYSVLFLLESSILNMSVTVYYIDSGNPGVRRLVVVHCLTVALIYNRNDSDIIYPYPLDLLGEEMEQRAGAWGRDLGSCGLKPHH